MSPVLRPDLADALRRDWGKLTIAAHRQSLITDALNSRRDCFVNPRIVGAVKRLCFYYPKTGEHILGQLLSRRIYDESAAIDFVSEELLPTQRPSLANASFRRYLAKNGRTAALGAVEIFKEHLEELEARIAEAELSRQRGFDVSSDGQRFPNNSTYLERARLRSMYSEFLKCIEGGTRSLMSIASHEEQIELLAATMRFRSDRIDHLIPALIDQARTHQFYATDWLIEAYQKRLAMVAPR